MTEYYRIKPKVERRNFEGVFASTNSIGVVLKNLTLLCRYYTVNINITVREPRSSYNYSGLEKVLHNKEAEIHNYIRV
jgi:hypothetical protein